MSGRFAEYPVVVERAYRNWSAYVPDLPVCVAIGRTRAAVKRSMREAMAFHMECLRDDHLPIPEPWSTTAMVQVQVPGTSDEPSENARQYLVVLEPETDGWSAYVPDVLGCTATGRTRVEAERNMQQALQTCLAEMRARGEPIPIPGRRTALIEVEVPQPGPVMEPSVQEARC
jgi:predicted RNase H-like HicB family nuclease